MNDYNKLKSALAKSTMSDPEWAIVTCGFTHLEVTKDFYYVTHSGNMGNSVTKSVNPNLTVMGYPTIATMKRKSKEWVEQGNPDYCYQLIVKR